ncbi:MAG: C39 family peptidase, partial [Thermoplasmata archaeon]
MPSPTNLIRLGISRRAVLLLAVPLALVALALASTPAQAEVVDLPVPYHRQVESWYCAEASLKMVFDYWGEEIPQHDIGDVANEREVGGTYTTDLVRAARFSNMSTSLQYREDGGARLEGYDQRTYGYATHVLQWTGSEHEEERYTNLMDLLREGYPVILLCWLDINHDITHYRVVKGFDTDTGDFLVHDPALGSNLRFNMTLLVDDLWTYYDRWAMVIAPWQVEVVVPDTVGPGEEFIVEGRVAYPCPHPFDEAEKVYTWPEDPVATITVPPPFALAPGQNVTQPLAIGRGGDADAVNWTVVSPVEPGFWSADIGVVAEATVTDYAISYGWYTDRAGGVGKGTVGCDAMPPVIESFNVADGMELISDPSVPFAYTTSDAHSGVSMVEVSNDGGRTWEVLLGTSGGRDLELDLGDGAYEIVLRATDMVGNQATATSSLVLDTTAPRIVLFQLAGGQEMLTAPQVQVTVLAEDDTGEVDLMALRVGDSQWGVWEPFRSELQITLPTDGEYRVEVRVRDTVGNVAIASDRVVLDTTAPYIT